MKLPFFKKRGEDQLVAEVALPETVGISDIIAPSSIEVSPNYVKIGERLAKTFFIFSYPSSLTTGWFSPIINLDTTMDIGIFIHPVDMAQVLKQLRKKVTEVQADIIEREEKGLIRDPQTEMAFRNLEELREKFISAQERMFRVGIYITIYADSEKQLTETEVFLRSAIEGRLVYSKPATFQQKKGFISTSPYGIDALQITTSMNTAPVSSAFPFVSFDLSSNDGILYGINQHNNSLILFDRFTLENSNAVIFGTSGSGKSYLVKLDALRSLMIGANVIIIDPENEYKALADTVGGSFFNISLSSNDRINPFDLPPPREGERPEDVLRSNTMNLVGLLRIMLGGLTPEEDAIIDRALTETYAAKDITPDSDFSAATPPLLSDLEDVLSTMEGAENLTIKLRKFTQGTYSSFFNQHSNVSMDNNMIVFGIRDMEEQLRPIAMYIIMRYIWNQVRSILKKRVLIIDEAWWLMQTEDGASFLYGLVKRSRKYWLGVTTITQDVGDFMKSEYGKPIITNSALKILMKQSPATINLVQQTFNLTEEEKYILLEPSVGEGIFFAGQKHVAIKVMASYTEDQIITTDPGQLAKIKRAKADLTE
ncbi:MAG: Type IV secretory pathway VirB4 component-like protein [Parcubacteria group bacterium GW2011_GWA1_36_12]|nr:MAG: Type IV secretory pathway VirB4 component-like protein [Parcubacteria group bacterium GW2011_GWA1_36_12]